MFFVQGIDILSGNEVNLFVPVAVQGIQLSELFVLFVGKVAEVFKDYVHCRLFFQIMYGRKAKLYISQPKSNKGKKRMSFFSFNIQADRCQIVQ